MGDTRFQLHDYIEISLKDFEEFLDERNVFAMHVCVCVCIFIWAKLGNNWFMGNISNETEKKKPGKLQCSNRSECSLERQK